MNMLEKIKQTVINEGKILGVSLLVGLLLAFGFAAYTFVYSHAAQQSIADNVIRFHVRANSDGRVDQELKEYVRLEVLAEFEALLSRSTSIEETRTVLTEKLADIEAYAQAVVLSAGHKYPVRAEIGRMFFPTRFYGNMSFPPGEYEAVKIIIGEGEGSNWWCLMFPPLCYVDMTATETSRNLLAETVPEEGFRLLTHQEEQRTGLTVRFRIVEWWQNRGQDRTQEAERNFLQR